MVDEVLNRRGTISQPQLIFDGLEARLPGQRLQAVGHIDRGNFGVSDRSRLKPAHAALRTLHPQSLGQHFGCGLVPEVLGASSFAAFTPEARS